MNREPHVRCKLQDFLLLAECYPQKARLWKSVEVTDREPLQADSPGGAWWYGWVRDSVKCRAPYEVTLEVWRHFPREGAGIESRGDFVWVDDRDRAVALLSAALLAYARSLTAPKRGARKNKT